MTAELLSLVNLAKAIGEFFRGRQQRRSDRINKIADHMDAVADSLQSAASTYASGRAPYREYIELQRYAATFGDVARVAFEDTDDGDEAYWAFVAVLEDSITTIAAVDARLFGFENVPFPGHLWNGKTPYIDGDESAAVENPPISEADLRPDPWWDDNQPDQPSPSDLLEAAGAFRAQANILRVKS